MGVRSFPDFSPGQKMTSKRKAGAENGKSSRCPVRGATFRLTSIVNNLTLFAKGS
jgi:hypothetical protein